MIRIENLPYLLILLTEVVAALSIGATLCVRGRDRLPAERLSLFLCPIAVLMTLTFVVHKIAESPDHEWNGARLAPVVGLWYGAEMYVGPDGPGAIMNTIYPPLSYLVYLPATLISNPTYAIMAGSCISAAVFFAPALLLSFPRGENGRGRRCSLMGIAATVGFFQAMLFSKSLWVAAFFIHADAPTMGFLGLACLALSRRRGETARSSTTYLVSAILAAMALWSKQTSLPMVAALPFWVLLTDGFRPSVRFFSYLAAAVAAFGFVFSGMVDVEALLFNMFAIPGKHPWFPQAPDLARSFLVLSAEYFCVVAGPLACLLLVLFARRRLTPGGDPDSSTSGLRRRLDENPWLLFVLMAITAIPTSLLSRIKVGGHWNNYAPAPYFLGLALLALLMEWHATNLRRGLRSFNASLTLIVLIAVLSPMTRGDESFRVMNVVHPLSSNPQEIAYRYALRHPGMAYFPWHPLSSLLAEGKLYHFEFGMSDRELAGYPVSQPFFRQNIPANVRYVCFPAGHKVFNKRFEKTMAYLPEFTRRVEIEELPGWTCYER
jgi:hypothetical protein